MRFSIPRVASSVEVERFLHQFYLPRRPVVIEGAAADWPAIRSWSPAYLAERLERSPASVTRAPYWWDIDSSLLADDVEEPPLVAALRRLRAPRERARSMRLWTSSRGHHTPWHYDGNCVDIFNVQVAGRKRFTIVSPETPIALAPFSIMGAQPDEAPARLLSPNHDYTEFELRSGDLLYLPRHWFHFVESLDEWNANINWVWTDLASGSLDNPVSARERDLVASLYPLFAAERRLVPLGRALGLPRLRVKQFNHEYTSEYGGARDFVIPRRFLRERGWRRAYRALLAELVASIDYALQGRG